MLPTGLTELINLLAVLASLTIAKIRSSNSVFALKHNREPILIFDNCSYKLRRTCIVSTLHGLSERKSSTTRIHDAYGLDELGKLCTLYARSLKSFALGAAKIGLNYSTDEDDNDRDNDDDNDNDLDSEDNEIAFTGKKGNTKRKKIYPHFHHQNVRNQIYLVCRKILGFDINLQLVTKSYHHQIAVLDRYEDHRLYSDCTCDPLTFHFTAMCQSFYCKLMVIKVYN
uniref:SWIM-type domain-containing protein n=1 Tax=Glossina austeni TaxID=7395 RepID=A0A1A9UF26_GLOAU